jgi:uncharacterized protein
VVQPCCHARQKEAARLRREIAAEMSPAQIAAAQRAARDWLDTH